MKKNKIKKKCKTIMMMVVGKKIIAQEKFHPQENSHWKKNKNKKNKRMQIKQTDKQFK